MDNVNELPFEKTFHDDIHLIPYHLPNEPIVWDDESDAIIKLKNKDTKSPKHQPISSKQESKEEPKNHDSFVDIWVEQEVADNESSSQEANSRSKEFSDDQLPSLNSSAKDLRTNGEPGNNKRSHSPNTDNRSRSKGSSSSSNHQPRTLSLRDHKRSSSSRGLKRSHSPRGHKKSPSPHGLKRSPPPRGHKRSLDRRSFLPRRDRSQPRCVFRSPSPRGHRKSPKRSECSYSPQYHRRDSKRPPCQSRSPRRSQSPRSWDYQRRSHSPNYKKKDPSDRGSPSPKLKRRVYVYDRESIKGMGKGRHHSPYNGQPWNNGDRWGNSSNHGRSKSPRRTNQHGRRRSKSKSPRLNNNQHSTNHKNNWHRTDPQPSGSNVQQSRAPRSNSNPRFFEQERMKSNYLPQRIPSQSEMTFRPQSQNTAQNPAPGAWGYEQRHVAPNDPRLSDNANAVPIAVGDPRIPPNFQASASGDLGNGPALLPTLIQSCYVAHPMMSNFHLPPPQHQMALDQRHNNYVPYPRFNQTYASHQFPQRTHGLNRRPHSPPKIPISQRIAEKFDQRLATKLTNAVDEMSKSCELSRMKEMKKKQKRKEAVKAVSRKLKAEQIQKVVNKESEVLYFPPDFNDSYERERKCSLLEKIPDDSERNRSQDVAIEMVSVPSALQHPCPRCRKKECYHPKGKAMLQLCYECWKITTAEIKTRKAQAPSKQPSTKKGMSSQEKKGITRENEKSAKQIAHELRLAQLRQTKTSGIVGNGKIPVRRDRFVDSTVSSLTGLSMDRFVDPSVPVRRPKCTGSSIT